MPLDDIATRRLTPGLLPVTLLALFSAGAVADDDLAPASLGIPAVEACSTRYTQVAAPAPAADNGADAHAAIREGFATHRHWGTEEHAELLAVDATGLGEPGLRVHYPAGSSSPADDTAGGAGFYADPPALEGAERACLSYRVRFPDGFDFVRGGKLPGLYAGEAPSGGETADGENGFSLRLMWREQGQGELYPYLPGLEGASVGRGAWRFPTGEWVSIEQEVVLNAPDAEDGLLRLWVDGRPVLEVRDLVYRTTPALTIDGLMFSTFFGGTGEGWRTPHDQHVDFADFRFHLPAS